jgi:hypothetical protein
VFVLHIFGCAAKDPGLPPPANWPSAAGLTSNSAGSLGSTTRPLPEAPEDVAREFMAAMFRRDRERFAQLAVPHPNLGRLLQNVGNATPAQVEEEVALFATLRIERLKPGDELADPFEPGQFVLPQMVDQGQLVLKMYVKGERQAWTHFLIKLNGRWRVRVDWMIDGLFGNPDQTIKFPAPELQRRNGPTDDIRLKRDKE